MKLSKSQLRMLSRLDGKVALVEGTRLAELAALVPKDQAIVEVGSYRGKSACYLATGAKAGNGAHVYAVDLWTVGGQRDKHGGYGIKAPYSKPETFHAFLSQIELAGVADRVSPITSSSQDAARDWRKPIGLLFIDAEHSYEACLADIDAWSQHIVPGGWIALHDYSSHFPGVKRAAAERILDRPEWDSVQVDGTVLSARRVQ
jgi:predicted O-methyltransferase YrrM